MSHALTPTALGVLAAVFGALVVGSTARLVALRADTTDRARSRRASLRTWWALTLLMTASVLAGTLGICLLLAGATWMAFTEYGALEAKGRTERFASNLLRLTIPVVYLAIYLGSGLTVLAVLPLVAVLLVATSEIVHGVTRGYVRTIGALVFGSVVLIGGPGHAALMVAEHGGSNSVGGVAGWFIFLLVLTELNDIAQAIVGRRIGRHHVTPKVSPNKTWEGLVGGIVVTMAAAMTLAPFLTPLTTAWSLAAGLATALGGFLGDLNISAVKRDTGVKDSSTALPGMGGVLDRIDSLTLTAPILYWLVVTPTS